jgi:hypothetical protein
MDEPAIAVVIPAYNASRFLTVVGTGLSAALTALARQETTGNAESRFHSRLPN